MSGANQGPRDNNMKFKPILPLLLAFASALPCTGQMTFKKAEIKSTYAGAEQGDKGDLIVDAERHSLRQEQVGTMVRAVESDHRDFLFPRLGQAHQDGDCRVASTAAYQRPQALPDDGLQ